MSQKKDHLINTAAELFCHFGYHATGIDTVIKQAKVAKMTMYSHFKSKDELIAATLESLDKQRLEGLQKFLDGKTDRPKQKLSMFFPYLEEVILSGLNDGCPFLRAVSEFPDATNVARKIAIKHKEKMKLYFQELAQEAGLSDPPLFAQSMQILMEGVMNMYQFSESREVFKTGHSLMQDLIELYS